MRTTLKLLLTRVLYLVLTLGIAGCGTASGAAQPQPTATHSPQFLAAQAVCNDATDTNGTAIITNTHGTLLDQISFYEPFVIHARYRYPIAAEDLPTNPVAGMGVSRIDATNTPQDVQITTVELDESVVGATEISVPFKLPIANGSALTLSGTPSTTPGLYCFSIEVTFDMNSPNGTESAAVLIAVR